MFLLYFLCQVWAFFRFAGFEVGAGGTAPDSLGFGAGVEAAEDGLTADTGLIVVEDCCLFHGDLLSIKEAELGILGSVAIAADNIVIVCVDGFLTCEGCDTIVAMAMVFRFIDKPDHGAVLAIAFVFPFVSHRVFLSALPSSDRVGRFPVTGFRPFRLLLC